MAPQTIVIIGAGFSGTMLALHLLQQGPTDLRVVLIERSSHFGLGQAYVTANPHHLLNVPAGRMGAYPDQPEHFLAWLAGRDAAEPGDFVPRRLYGAYLRDLLERGRQTQPHRLRLVSGDAVHLADGPELTLTLDDGRKIAASAAVLAVGNFEPQSVLPGDTLRGSPHYRANPWTSDATTGLDPQAAVLLLGTGLTMVDTVLSLLDAGHHGPIHAVSRHGLAPLRHAGAAVGPLPPVPDYPATVLGLLRCLRADAAACAKAAGWQSALDRFQPYGSAAWIAMDAAQRNRFLRHMRPLWAVHRHRIAPAVADRIDAARAQLQLRISGGRVREVTEHQGGVEVVIMPRAERGLVRIRAARVINCTGPTSDYRRVADPLVRGLLQDGLVRPDALHLGLDVALDGGLVDHGGTPSRRLFGLGPVTRGTFYEITAVPNIRGQCAALAQRIVAGQPQGGAAIPPPAPSTS